MKHNEELKSYLLLKYDNMDDALDAWLHDQSQFDEKFTELFRDYAMKILPDLLKEVRQEIATRPEITIEIG